MHDALINMILQETDIAKAFPYGESPMTSVCLCPVSPSLQASHSKTTKSCTPWQALEFKSWTSVVGFLENIMVEALP